MRQKERRASEVESSKFSWVAADYLNQRLPQVRKRDMRHFLARRDSDGYVTVRAARNDESVRVLTKFVRIDIDPAAPVPHGRKVLVMFGQSKNRYDRLVHSRLA
jgi:hypothetical protein